MLTLRKMVAGRGHCGTIIRVGGEMRTNCYTGYYRIAGWVGEGMMGILSYFNSYGAHAHLQIISYQYFILQDKPSQYFIFLYIYIFKTSQDCEKLP